MQKHLSKKDFWNLHLYRHSCGKFLKMERLSKEKIAELKEAFALFDKDGDGRITANELENVMRSMGENPTSKELSKIIQDLDTDGSGAIEFNEFSNLMSRRYSEIKEMKEITDAFKMFDRNGDGVISAGELRQVMTNMGQKLSDKDVDSMIKEADMDGDGQINYAEFIRMMRPAR